MSNPHYLAGRSKPEFETGIPARQGFYEVQLKDASELLAEWRDRNPKLGKIWWQHVSADPTIAKVPVPLDQNVVGYRKADKSTVENHLHRELTRDELIQRSYARFVSDRDSYPYVSRLAIPPSRLLHIGDKVEIGMLQDAVVIAVHDEGKAITVQHAELRVRESRNNPGIPVTSIGTWPWTSAYRLEDMTPSKLTNQPIQYLTYLNSGLDSLVHRMYRCSVEDNPDYQRGYVWTEEDKQRYLESIFEARDLGRFIFVEYDYPRVDELFDGKQRLSTIMDLIESRIAYRGVYWHQMSPSDRNAVENRPVQFAELNGSRIPRVELLQIFLMVNAAGVPQTEAHLDHVKSLIAAELQKQ